MNKRNIHITHVGMIALGTILSAGLIAFYFYYNSTLRKPVEREITWEKAKTLLQECKVLGLGYTHRKKYAELINGETVVISNPPDGSSFMFQEAIWATERCGFGVSMARD